MAKILIIEDESDIRESIEEILDAEGHTVFTAENGAIGVEKAKDVIPDLIISDIMMPELDGYGVCLALREDPLTEAIPFVFLSAKSEKQDIRKGMNLGADDFINKPFTISELLSTVQSRLKRKTVHHQMAEKKITEFKEKISFSLPHELYTPLSSILGFAEALKSDCAEMTSEEIIESAAFIHEGAERLKRTIERILFNLHLQFLFHDSEERGKLRSSITEVTRNLFEEKLLSLPSLKVRYSDFQLNIVPAELSIHPDYFCALAEEVLSNCVKFSDPGTPITVQTELRGNSYYLQFTDLGKGMTADEIASTGSFTQFNRTIYDQQGTGNGVSIIRQIVALFEGSITFDTSGLQGLTVKVLLPCAV